MRGSERCESRTLISLENWRRIPPAFFPVDPQPRRSRSKTTTLRTPFRVRWNAMDAPMIPPPMMTTSAVRSMIGMVGSQSGSVCDLCRRGELNPQALAGGSPWSCCVFRFTTSAGREHYFSCLRPRSDSSGLAQAVPPFVSVPDRPFAHEPGRLWILVEPLEKSDRRTLAVLQLEEVVPAVRSTYLDVSIASGERAHPRA